ncbi:MAG: (Fe-S)-binding protein [Desulfovibrionaceae bacterium]
MTDTPPAPPACGASAAPDTPRECILCGRCLDVCPLFRATGREELSPKAKHYLNKFLDTRPGELDTKPAASLASLCLACGRCEKECPQGLSGPAVVASLRGKHAAWESWLWKTWIERGGVLWPALGALARFAPDGLAGERFAPMLKLLKAMTRRKTEPWLAVTRYDVIPSCANGPQAALFPGCTAQHAQPAWLGTARALLAGVGYAVLPEPDWACCGLTLAHAGLPDSHALMMRRNIDLWRKAGRPQLAVFCATCLHGLTAYADPANAHVTAWEPGEAQAWLAALAPLSGLLRGTQFTPTPSAPDRVLYHRPCHGANTTADLDLLRAILGDRLVRTSTDACCGMGGVMQLGAPELSRQVAAACWDFFDAQPGDHLLTGCSGCVIQLRATAPQGVTVSHWLDCIAP